MRPEYGPEKDPNNCEWEDNNNNKMIAFSKNSSQNWKRVCSILSHKPKCNLDVH